jgi:hypothetical protein
VLSRHLIGRFNTGGNLTQVEWHFFVGEWRFFFADRVASMTPRQCVHNIHTGVDHAAASCLGHCAAASNAPAYGQNHRTVYEQKWQFICRQKNYILHKLFTVNLTFIPLLLLLLLLLIVSADIRIDPPCADRISPL